MMAYGTPTRVAGVVTKIQGGQKVSRYLMITTEKVTSNVQSVPRQSPDIYVSDIYHAHH
jgi:hypothetical protein